MYFLVRNVKFDTKQVKPIEFERIKTKKKLTANLDTIINNDNHLTNFLNSGKTWMNKKDMYLHTYCTFLLTYLSDDRFVLTILMSWWFFFQISEQITGDT